MEHEPAVLIIVGITGDLARRKLLPALLSLKQADALPQSFMLLGLSRREVSVDEVVAGLDDPDGYLPSILSMRQLDYESDDDYRALGEYLDSLPDGFGSSQRLFYLSVPPTATPDLVARLGTSGLATKPQTKLLLEKPFGVNLPSAHEYLETVTSAFPKPEMVYYLDHYLAKAAAQSLVVLRSHNAPFVRSWDASTIARIEIEAAEQLSIEGRAGFYEQTGALGDLIQSHLLQMLALVLMEPPRPDNWSELPARRLQALSQLQVVQGDAGVPSAIRGQYKGYKEAAGNDASTTETFVALDLSSTDPRWQGTTMSLVTGKALDAKRSQIRIVYHDIDAAAGGELIIRLDPKPAVIQKMWVKRPGYVRSDELVEATVPFESQGRLPEAYEQIFYDALTGNHAVFTTPDEIFAAWNVLAPLQASWHAQGATGLKEYDQGSSVEAITRG